MKYCSLLVFFFCFLGIASAQNKQVETRSYPRLIHDNDKMPRGNAYGVFKKYFDLTGDDELNALSSKSDELGFTHDAFQQYYKKVKVEGAIYTIHSKNGIIETLSGEFKGIKGLDVRPSLSNTQAFEKALTHVNAKLYAWDPSVSDGYPSYKKPIGELVVIGGSEGDQLRPTLAWKFDIYAVEPLYRAEVYIDAKTGEVLRENQLIHTSNIAANASTRYNGSQNITADYTGTNYRLRQTSSGGGVETYSLNNGTNYGTATDIVSSSTTFTSDPVANQAHWGAERTYDYYNLKHNRNSFNNAGAKILSYVHYSTNYVNAFWDGSRMTYGDGDGVTYGPLVSLDICGHEITHGVTTYSANLTYSNESGALNESFSDIFGESIENFAKGSNDWLMSCDIGLNGCGAFRSMSNPNAYGDPDTYKGTNWYSGTADNGGVHQNSGVQNKWFYILVNGESGTNDLGNAYSVTGLGIDKAAKIAYRNLTVYLTASSGYANARAGAIQAAIDLYGAGSPEAIATAEAWYAVGVGCKAGTICYCASQGNSQADEWIAGVSIGSFSNTSGASPYTFFSTNTISLNSGVTYNINLTPGFRASTFPEYWRIWIDYNKDADFDDLGELVYDAGATSSSAKSGTISIDPAATGSTRMRVSMKYNAAPTPCETFTYGEVEDYPITFTTGAPPPPVTETLVAGYSFNANLESWSPSSTTNCKWYTTSTSLIYEGAGAVLLQGKGTTVTSPNNAVNLSSYGQSTVDFFFYPLSVETKENLVVSYSNDGGTTYNKLGTFTSGTAGVQNLNFANGSFYKGSITFNNTAFGNNVRFRFAINGNDVTDQFYIDSVRIKGRTGTTAGTGVTLKSVTKPLNGLDIESVYNKNISAAVELSNPSRSTITAYPNPFSDRLTIQVNAKRKGAASIVLYNLSGQKVMTVYEGNLNEGVQTFELSVPPKLRQRLVYIFRQNGEVLSGQLFGVK